MNAQLIDTRTDTHIWAEQYDRDLNELFAVQSEIAQKVAEQLHAKIRLLRNWRLREADQRSHRFRALFARQKSCNLSRAGATALRQTIDLPNQAVARDPSFFDAYCGLAWFHDLLYFYGFDHTPTRVALAEAALQAAFRIRPNAAEAHLARAYHLYNGYRNYDGALAELEAAARNLPNNRGSFRAKRLHPKASRTLGRSLQEISSEHSSSTRATLECSTRSEISYAFLRRYAEQKSTVRSHIGHRAK